MILDHRLSPEDPIAMRDSRWESRASEMLLGEQVSTGEAGAVVA
jgi:hypothetical protein